MQRGIMKANRFKTFEHPLSLQSRSHKRKELSCFLKMREEPRAKIIICGDKHSESQELSSENIFCQVYVLLNSQVVKKLSSLYEYLVVVNVLFTAVRVFFDQ